MRPQLGLCLEGSQGQLRGLGRVCEQFPLPPNLLSGVTMSEIPPLPLHSFGFLFVPPQTCKNDNP